MSIEYAASLIRAGKLVAFPTETVYGLGASAFDPEALARIFAAKRRPLNDPLILHVDSMEMARELASAWPPAAEELARRYWPGPLTLVVPKDPRVPDVATAGLPTVGVRMPAHPIALELICAAGVPIAAPSANRFTHLSPTTAEHVRASLGDAVDYILDGGPSRIGIESTVMSVDPPVLFRPGVIPYTDLEEVTGPLGRAQAGAGAQPSPGMHKRHYQPLTPLYLGKPPAHGHGFWLWLAAGRNGDGMRMPTDPRGYAAVLYSTLHSLDRQRLDWIAVEPPPDSPEWAGVLDRLRRAATV